MIRLGLCCQFVEVPIKFRTTTVTACKRMSRTDRLEKLSGLCLDNAKSLFAAFEYCIDQGIGCFRVNSQILPCKTHDEVGYRVEELPEADKIVDLFHQCGSLARANELRVSFHPDQFVVLNSPKPEVVRKSLAELEYQSEVAEWVGADVVNIHGGGAYGDKPTALKTFAQRLGQLSERVRDRLTVENDDRVFTPEDLLPICRAENVPLVYDVHHHRCLADALAVVDATEAACETWDREPMFHISSPKQGWKGPQPHRHHDFIDIRDFPDEWLGLDLTVEVEAKAKERAVNKLSKALARKIKQHTSKP